MYNISEIILVIFFVAITYFIGFICGYKNITTNNQNIKPNIIAKQIQQGKFMLSIDPNGEWMTIYLPKNIKLKNKGINNE